MAGFLPILSVHLAYGLNIQAGLEGCNPYWDGCISVSAAARSGPGLWWFKGLAIPAAICMIMAWRGLTTQGLGSTAARLGMMGALFFLVYAAALGTDGDVYRWMRRYGVVFYFGLTGLAQVNGDYHSTPANKLRYDLAYQANWSVWLDLTILMRTVKTVVTSRGT